MTTPAHAVETLERDHGRVRDLLAGIPDEELVAPATIGGGEWSAKDLLGHLTTWEEFAFATVDEWQSSARPSIAETLAADGIDDLNANEVERKAALPLEEVRRTFEGVHARLVAAIGRMSDAEWGRPASWEGADDETLGMALGAILGSAGLPFGHVSAHEADVRAFSEERRPS